MTLGLDLRRLRVSPRQVAEAFAAYWPGCGLQGLTLYLA